MFQAFDDTAADAFIETLKKNTVLAVRMQNPSKLDRLRSLGNVVLERVSAQHSGRPLLEALVSKELEPEFFQQIVPKLSRSTRPPPRRPSA
jgi:hypothetical protein